MQGFKNGDAAHQWWPPRPHVIALSCSDCPAEAEQVLHAKHLRVHIVRWAGVEQCWLHPATSSLAWFRHPPHRQYPALAALCGLAPACRLKASSPPDNLCFGLCSCRAPTGGFAPNVAAEVAKLVVQHAAALVLVLCHAECAAVRNGLHKWMADMAKGPQPVFGHPGDPQPADLLAASKARTSQVQLALLPGSLCVLQRMHGCLQGISRSPSWAVLYMRSQLVACTQAWFVGTAPQAPDRDVDNSFHSISNNSKGGSKASVAGGLKRLLSCTFGETSMEADESHHAQVRYLEHLAAQNAAQQEALEYRTASPEVLMHKGLCTAIEYVADLKLAQSKPPEQHSKVMEAATSSVPIEKPLAPKRSTREDCTLPHQRRGIMTDQAEDLTQVIYGHARISGQSLLKALVKSPAIGKSYASQLLVVSAIYHPASNVLDVFHKAFWHSCCYFFESA